MGLQEGARLGVVGEHQHRGLAGAREVARHAVHEVGADAVKVVQVLLDGFHRHVGLPLAEFGRPYIPSGFSGRWPIGWLRTAATTRSGARSISFSANEPPMQLPKKKNWRMPRWSISPNWSSAKAPHGSSTGIGPVDSPPVALRWSMVMQR